MKGNSEVKMTVRKADPVTVALKFCDSGQDTHFPGS